MSGGTNMDTSNRSKRALEGADNDHATLLANIRDMMRQEVLQPLRAEMNELSTTTKEIQKEQVSMQDKMRAMEDRIVQCEKNQKFVSNGGVTSRASSDAGSSASTVATTSCLFGGFPKDTRRSEIEEFTKQTISDLGVKHLVPKLYCPGIRSSICRCEVAQGSEFESSRSAAFHVMSVVREKGPMTFKGSTIWFTLHKSPHERAVAAFTARSMRMVGILGADTSLVEGDFRRGIVWIGSDRVCDFTVSAVGPLPGVLERGHNFNADDIKAACSFLILNSGTSLSFTLLRGISMALMWNSALSIYNCWRCYCMFWSYTSVQSLRDCMCMTTLHGGLFLLGRISLPRILEWQFCSLVIFFRKSRAQRMASISACVQLMFHVLAVSNV